MSVAAPSGGGAGAAGPMTESVAIAEPVQAAQRASGSSFYVAMRILPRPQREAMFEIYAFCRAVDDVADDPGARGQRMMELERWRSDVDALYAGAPPPRLQGLAVPVRSFSLKREDFLAIIDGMEMDVVSDMRAPDLATLDLYCDRVASAVGRLSVRVFGMPQDDGIALAHQLGRALQLTNILRDLDEDAAIGRLYLPRDYLWDAGIISTDPVEVLHHPLIEAACAPMVARAHVHFAEANAIMARHPRRTVRAPRIMGEAYRMILAGLATRGFAPPRRRVHLSKPRLLWTIVRHAIF
jgi:squalene synthase HpnD